jgi:hypothetical protein
MVNVPVSYGFASLSYDVEHAQSSARISCRSYLVGGQILQKCQFSAFCEFFGTWHFEINLLPTQN